MAFARVADLQLGACWRLIYLQHGLVQCTHACNHEQAAAQHCIVQAWLHYLATES